MNVSEEIIKCLYAKVNVHKPFGLLKYGLARVITEHRYLDFFIEYENKKDKVFNVPFYDKKIVLKLKKFIIADIYLYNCIDFCYLTESQLYYLVLAVIFRKFQEKPIYFDKLPSYSLPEIALVDTFRSEDIKKKLKEYEKQYLAEKNKLNSRRF